MFSKWQPGSKWLTQNNWWLGYQGQICSPFWHPNLKSPPGNLYKRLVAICPPQSSQEKVGCQHFKPGGKVNPPFRGHIASPVLKLSFWRFKHSCCSGGKNKHSMDSRQTNDPMRQGTAVLAAVDAVSTACNKKGKKCLCAFHFISSATGQVAKYAKYIAKHDSHEYLCMLTISEF